MREHNIASADIFDAYLTCPSQCWFRFKNEVAADNMYSQLHTGSVEFIFFRQNRIRVKYVCMSTRRSSVQIRPRHQTYQGVAEVVVTPFFIRTESGHPQSILNAQ